tara:strand:+ start:583 stop:2265 length:1683 start_codon:yes stop_codon:yes gene_type:complete
MKEIKSKILALKYRPRIFQELIGQEVIAETISNAIKINKTPNAYLLTGIRGVGKTTTARLIAKALNCSNNVGKGEMCKDKEVCNHCQEIENSNHIDVLEMDAASKTGIDDVRELIENSKYNPTNAKYKIFIIDEVHMLSKQAFNGLLKTLEEPPEKLKFILATTEARKIPITVLSRCQRFDLKRVSLEAVSAHLKKISKIENGKISEEALNLLARASEGSVRDAISLLDRALVFQSLSPDKIVDAKEVRKMLGLVDRSKLIYLLKYAFHGDEKNALGQFKEIFDEGIDAKIFLNDILELFYLFSRRINLGPIEKDLFISEGELKLIDESSKNINTQDLGLFWQLTIKTIEDLRTVSSEKVALEMYLIQLMHVKNMDEHEIVKNFPSVSASEPITQKKKFDINGNDPNPTNSTKDQLKSVEQIKVFKDKKLESGLDLKNKFEIRSFHDLVSMASNDKDMELKYDLERNVKLVKFEHGKIDINFNENLNKNFIKKLSQSLFKWTKKRWIISLSKEDGKSTLHEQKIEGKKKLLENEKQNLVYKKILNTFPDADLIDVKEDND